jgi:hypothetical protein
MPLTLVEPAHDGKRVDTHVFRCSACGATETYSFDRDLPIPKMAARITARITAHNNTVAHSITSSARPSSGIGIVRPSVLAVFRLITNSIFVACWTGKSVGLAPLRILPV